MAPRKQAFEPVALDTALAARLQEAMAAVLTQGGDGNSNSLLRDALDDPATCSVVLSLTVGAGAPAAVLLQVVQRSDPLAAWIGLSCI